MPILRALLSVIAGLLTFSACAATAGDVPSLHEEHAGPAIARALLSDPRDAASVEVSFCSAPEEVLLAGWFALDDSGAFEQIQVFCRERSSHRFELRAGEVTLVVARIDDDRPRFAAQRIGLQPGEHRDLDLRAQSNPLRPNMVELVGHAGQPVEGATVVIEPQAGAPDDALLRWVNRYARPSDRRGVALLLSQETPLMVSIQLPGFAQAPSAQFWPGQAQLHVPTLRPARCRFREPDGEQAPYGHVFLDAQYEGGTVRKNEMATAVRSGDFVFGWPPHAAVVQVASPGFVSQTLRSPRDDCQLVRIP